ESRPVDVVVHRSVHPAGLDRHHPHAQPASGHAVDLRAEVDRGQGLDRDAPRLGWRLLVAHRALLSRCPGRNAPRSRHGAHRTARTTGGSARRRQGVNSLQCPSETTSTAPPTTLMAVSSSIAYAGFDKPAAQRSAAAMVFSDRSGLSRCGKIEKSTTPRVRSPAGACQLTKSIPTRGVSTMLPALRPTQTVSSSDGRRSARPEARSQWHRYAASPPSTSRTSVSRTSG